MVHIETKRLILRDWIDGDLKSLVDINQDPKVLEFLPSSLTREETKAMMEKAANHIYTKGYGRFACEEKGTGKFIGFVGLGPAELHNTTYIEIGWRLGSLYWGKGYATEAAQAVVYKAFMKDRLEEIISFTVYNNIRSRRVMEKIRLIYDIDGDFQHPRLPKDHPFSWHVLYRLTKEQYRKDLLGWNILKGGR